MGIFKKVFGNGKEKPENPAIEEEEEEDFDDVVYKEPEKRVTKDPMMQQRLGPSAVAPSPEQLAEDNYVRRAARSQVPTQDEMKEKGLQTVIDEAFDAVFHCVNLNIRIVSVPMPNGQMGAQLKVDPAIEQWIDHRERTTLDDDLANADTNAMLRLWVVLDMVSNGNRLRGLSQVKDWMVDELVERKAVALPEKGSVEQMKEILRSQQQMDQQRRQAMQARLMAAAKQGQKVPPMAPMGMAESVIKAEKKLGEKLLEQDNLWIAMDAVNSMYPSFGQMGQMEVFTSEENAVKAVKFMGEQKVSLSAVAKIEKKDFNAFFSIAARCGASIFTVDNGTDPVNMQLGAVVQPIDDGLIENANRSVRNAIIREVQISTRMQKFNMKPGPDAPAPERAQAQAMLTLRCNMFRVIGHGLMVVLAKDIPTDDNCTRYTPAAYQLACELMERNHLKEEVLCLPGDTKSEVYDGPLSLQVMTPGSDKTAADGMLCVFTGKVPAARMAAASGSGMVVVTYQEWMVHAQKCSGVVIDPATLGYIIPATRYEEVNRYAAMEKPIMVRLQDEPKAEAPKTEESKPEEPKAEEVAPDTQND